jgi:hypothetical protein
MFDAGPVTFGQVIFISMFFYGTTFLIKDSTILKKPREWVCRAPFVEALLSCSFCTGVWVGGLWGVWKGSTLKLGACDFVEAIVVFSMVSATACYIIDLITQLAEKRLEE